MSKLTALRTIKLLHELGSVGLMGGVAAILVLRHKAPGLGSDGFVATCHTVDQLHRLLVVPSMLVCVFSGFASMMVHRPYWNALWAWAKAASGIVVLNFNFRMQNLARGLTDAETLASRAALVEGLHKEAIGLWVLVVVSALNIVVGIWRPRFRRLLGRSAKAAAADAD